VEHKLVVLIACRDGFIPFLYKFLALRRAVLFLFLFFQNKFLYIIFFCPLRKLRFCPDVLGFLLLLLSSVCTGSTYILLGNGRFFL
jgi:hypothetical protein